MKWEIKLIASTVFNFTAYLPEALIPSYENFKDNLVSIFSTVGLIPQDADSGAGESAQLHFQLNINADYSSATSEARTTYQEAERKLEDLKKQNSNAQEELARLFDVDFYGKQGEWKKLDKLCLSKDTGE